MIGSKKLPRLILILTCLLLALGVGLRVVPIVGSDDRMLQVFPTEDGYLMLTIARNMAIGNGMSVAEGTIPTNGTQPLTTFEWALCFLLSGGGKALGVRLTLFAQLATSLLTVFLMYRLGCRLLQHRNHGRSIAALATAAWFASPLVIPNSMNCLETGNYALLTIAVVTAFLHAGNAASREWPWRRVLATGVLLGVTFWIRNDAVFLVLAACLVYMTRAGRFEVAEMQARLSRTLVMGFTSIAVALPWLLHNQANFGSIMPISGHAEANGATLGSNLDLVSSMVLEYVGIFTQIPNTMQGTLFVEIGSFLVLALMAVALRRHFKQANDVERSAIFVIVVFGSCLVAFYGLYFGAPHFVSRYFFPMSPVLAILSMQGLFAVWQFLRKKREAMAMPFVLAFTVVAVALLVGLNVRRYQRSVHHMHFQAVEWIDENVPEQAWIGAPQTGTIGFFHDRTVYLDGKVNPEAFEHVVAGTIPQYVVDKQLQYVIDWFGLADHWSTLPPLDIEFEVIVNDQELNLSVMRRRDRGK